MSAALSLYGLTHNHAGMELMIEDAIDQERPQEEIDRLLQEQLVREGQIEAKIDNYIRYIRHLEAVAAARQEESDRLHQLVQSSMSKVASMKQALKDGLKILGKPKLSTPHHEISVRKNGGKEPLIIEPSANPENLDQGWVKIVVTKRIDTDLIRQALENGEVLDFAHLGQRGDHLSIR